MKKFLLFLFLCYGISVSKTAGIGTIGIEYVYRIILFDRGGIFTGDSQIDFMNIAKSKPSGYTIAKAVVNVTPAPGLNVTSKILSCPSEGKTWEGDTDVNAGFLQKIKDASGQCFLVLKGTSGAAASTDAGIVLKVRLE
jgi:hypothetical protein